MRSNRVLLAAAVFVVALCGAVGGQEAKREEKPEAAAPAPAAPVKVDVTKVQEVEGVIDQDVVFWAHVESAKWSATGRMMIIRFGGTPENFRATAYQKQREALDKGFEGDFAKGIEGKDVEVTGKVRRYKGANEAWKDVIEVPITKPSQVKIVEKK